jgi:hypothetical protein
MRLAEQYLDSFGELAKETNTMILPANANDASSMVAQSMAIFNHLTNNPIQSGSSDGARGAQGTFNSEDPKSFEPTPLPEVIANINENTKK